MISVALLGYGRWGRNYARVLAALEGARLAAIADPSPAARARAAAEHPEAAILERPEDALALRGIDAAVVATPASTHVPLARASLLAGKHVLVEKPLALRSREAEAVTELGRRLGLTLLVGHTFIYNPGIRAMRALLEAEVSGELRYLTARRVNLGPVRSDASALWDLAPHDIAILNYLVGAPPLRVSAVAGCFLEPGRPDVAFLTLGYPRGIAAHVHVSWIDATKVREVVAVASARRIVFDDLRPDAMVRVFENAECPLGWEGGGVPPEGGFVADVAREEPLRVLCEHFVRCAAGRERPQTGGDDGVRVVRALEAAEASLARGGEPIAVEAETRAGAPR